MRGLLLAATLAAFALPGAAAAEDQAYPRGEAELAELLEGRVAGAPVACLPLYRLGGSTIIDKTAIVYRSGGGSRIYVNRPRGGASSLDDDQILVTRTSGSQLCRIDTVDLVDRHSGFRGGFVSLGDFVPYDRVKTSRR